jgi:hypothetical protein
MSKRVQCLHCLTVLPVGPDADVPRIHVGPGKPLFAEGTVVGAIMLHATEHPPHAWIEGRDYRVVDDDMSETTTFTPEAP